MSALFAVPLISSSETWCYPTRATTRPRIHSTPHTHTHTHKHARTHKLRSMTATGSRNNQLPPQYFSCSQTSFLFQHPINAVFLFYLQADLKQTSHTHTHTHARTHTLTHSHTRTRAHTHTRARTHAS